MTNIVRKRGDTFPITYNLVASGRTAYDLTGCALVMTVDPNKAPVDASTKVLTLTGFVADPLTGVVQFAMTGFQADLVGKFFFDVQMTTALGKVVTVDSGQFTLEQDITK